MMNFIFWTLIGLSVLIGLFGLGFLLYLLWRHMWSIKTLRPNEVGIPLYYGEPSHECGNPARTLCESGKVFVPDLFGMTWDGHPIWELIRVPKDTLKVTYKADAGDEIRTKDGVICFPETSVYFTYPFLELDSLKKMLTNNVPLGAVALTGDAALKAKYEDVVMPVVQDAYALYDSDQVAEKKKDISAFIETKLREVGGILHLDGIVGMVPTDKGIGKGWVSVQIESTGLPDAVNKAMQAPAIAKQQIRVAEQKVLVAAQEALVAKETAKIEGTLAGDPLLNAMKDWVESQKKAGETTQKATERLMRGGAKSLYSQHEKVVKDLILAKGGKLQVNQNLYGSPDGGPLPEGLTVLSVGGGGATGVLVGKGGSKNKDPKNMDDNDRQDAADKL
jgi:hypothetical protein